MSKEYKNNWARNNPDKVKASRAKSAEKIKAYQAQYRIDNAAHIKAYQGEYRAKAGGAIVAYRKKYYQDNKEAVCDKAKSWYVDNRELCLARQKDRYLADPGAVMIKQRKSRWKKNYGITAEEYNDMLEAQGGVCAICRKEHSDERPLHVDHCHTTGRVRGLLCRVCNPHLGTFEKKKAAFEEYLKRYGAGNPLIYGERNGENCSRKSTDPVSVRCAGLHAGVRDARAPVYEGLPLYAAQGVEGLRGGRGLAACLPAPLR